MSFSEFKKQKILAEEKKQVSVSLMRNLMDILKDYVSSEFKVSSDDRAKILSNMKISQEATADGRVFNANSFYMEDDETRKDVGITIEIRTTAETEDDEPTIEEPSSEETPEIEDEETGETGDDEKEVEEEYEEFTESFTEFKNKKLNS